MYLIEIDIASRDDHHFSEMCLRELTLYLWNGLLKPADYFEVIQTYKVFVTFTGQQYMYQTVPCWNLSRAWWSELKHIA